MITLGQIEYIHNILHNKLNVCKIQPARSHFLFEILFSSIFCTSVSLSHTHTHCATLSIIPCHSLVIHFIWWMCSWFKRALRFIFCVHKPITFYQHFGFWLFYLDLHIDLASKWTNGRLSGIRMCFVLFCLFSSLHIICIFVWFFRIFMMIWHLPPFAAL